MIKLKNIILRLSLMLLAIIAIISCNKEKTANRYLYPIKENGLYGYIDSVGNRIIEPQFLWVSTFRDGLALAVVDTIYREVPDSMAYEVGERDSVVNLFRMYAKYGYIDKRGRFAIKPTFVTYVTMPEKGYIVNDITDCRNALSRYTFHSRRALFCDTITWKNGYINNKGEIVIEPRYYYSDPYSEGLAVVRDAVAEPLYTNNACITPSRLRCAYVDTLGNAITEFKYESLTRFCSGRGIGNYKIINKETVDIADTTIIWETYSIPRFLINGDGKEIKELNFNYDYYGFSKDDISVCSDGFFFRSFVGKENISYFFIDIDGNFLEPLKGLSEYQLDSLGKCDDIMLALPKDAEISAATYFNDGFAGISPDKKHWFVIDKHLLIHGYGQESIFESFRGFNNGLAAVKRNGKWGFLNTKIEEQIPCKYDSCGGAYPYLEEIFEYDIQGNVKIMAYVNRKDSIVWEGKILKVNEIKNEYSNKEKKDWGKWTYKYNSFLYDILFWVVLALGALLVIVFIAWGVVRIRVSSKQAVMRINEQSVQMQATINNSTFTTFPSDNATEDEEIRFYPSLGQYTETIKLASKSPEEFFEKLSNLRPVFDTNGDPVMSNGNFAVVYKMVDDNGKFYAVRCFHRYQEGRNKGYKLICEELDKVSSPYLSPTKYFEKELYIDSVKYPVLLMDWVEGLTLDKYIRKYINDKVRLRSLADNFRQMAIWLLDQPFAHGDLKPDNILVKEDGSLVLIDYDGIYVPAMQGQKAREIGSPDFRNPSRTEDDFNKDIDTFPILSILISLKLLVENKDFLSLYGAEDRLLFSAKDYREIDNSIIHKIAYVSYDEYTSALAILMKNIIKGVKIDKRSIFKIISGEEREHDFQKNCRLEGYVSVCFSLYICAIILLLFVYSKVIPEIEWNAFGVSFAILCSTTVFYVILNIVDIVRPYKKYHINIDEDEGGSLGCMFSFILIIFVGKMLLSDYYDEEWYITIIILGAWCLTYTLLGSMLFLSELRVKLFMTPKEKQIEKEEKDKDELRNKLRKIQKQTL